MSTTTANAHLTSGRLLVRNTIWNLVGTCAPLVGAIVCIPPLTRSLGSGRFGLLTLAWALIGYASLFDLGLGRALTQVIARRLSGSKDSALAALMWTSLSLMFALGVAGSLIIWTVSEWLVQRGLNVPVAMRHEALLAFRVLGLSLPFVLTTSGLRGILEAHQRFGIINALRIPMGLLNFVGPLAVIPFSRSAIAVIAALVACRLLTWGAHLIACLLIFPELMDGLKCSAQEALPLIRFGSWMTVTNVVGPLMVTLDRFVIGGLVTIGAVAYYATPFEMVTKLWVIPAALTGVVFPAFAATADRDHAWVSLLFDRSVKVLLIVLFPLALLLITFAHEGLSVWLGLPFADNSFRVMQWLTLGVFINSIAQVPFTFLQGAGFPRVTAMLHLAELPLYLLLLWPSVRTYGIEGAAVAWTARCTFDAVAMFILARRLLPGSQVLVTKRLMALGVLPAAFLGAPCASTIVGKIAAVAATTGLFAVISWKELLTDSDKLSLKRHIQFS